MLKYVYLYLRCSKVDFQPGSEALRGTTCLENFKVKRVASYLFTCMRVLDEVQDKLSGELFLPDTVVLPSHCRAVRHVERPSVHKTGVKMYKQGTGSFISAHE